MSKEMREQMDKFKNLLKEDSNMEDNIPTAEEFLNNSDYYSHKDDSGDKVYYDGYVENLMIEFAKLHVEAALKAAAEKAEGGYDIEGAYPLDNIK